MDKLDTLADLIQQKKDIEQRIQAIISALATGAEAKPRRGRPRKEEGAGDQADLLKEKSGE